MATANYTGRDSIMSAIGTVSEDNPYWSLWRGKDLLTQHSVDDWDGAYVKLDDMLNAIEHSGSRELYTIKFHAKPEKTGVITNKSPIVASMLVRVVPLDTMGGIASPTQPGEMNNAVWHTMQAIKDGIVETRQAQNLIVERLLLLENKPPAIAETEFEEYEPDTIDKIGAILEKPGVMDLARQLLPVLTGVISKYMAIPNIAVNGAPANIANNSDGGSVSENAMATTAENSDTAGAIPHLNDAQYDQLDMVVHRLKKHTDTPIIDLDLLCDWADANPVMFKSLMSNLKPQGNG